MKIRFLKIFMICLAGSILCSCSKEKENSNLNLTPSGIKQIISTDVSSNNYVTTYKFSYQSGNLVQLTAIYSWGRDSILFSYNSDNKLIQLRWNAENITINYGYDKNGDIDTAEYVQSSLLQIWKYNDQHQLVSLSSPSISGSMLSMEWNSDGDVISADFLGSHYTISYDDKRNPFIGFPEHPVYLTGIINVGAYFFSPPTQNNVTYAKVVNGQNVSWMTLKYEYNNNSLPTKLYAGSHDGSYQDSVIYEFVY